MSEQWRMVEGENDSFGFDVAPDVLDSEPPTRGHSFTSQPSFRSNLSFPLSEGNSFDHSGGNSFDTGSGCSSANDASQRTNEFSDDERMLRDPLGPSLPPSAARHRLIVHPDSMDDESRSQLIMPVIEIDPQTGSEFLRHRQSAAMASRKAGGGSSPAYLAMPPRVQPGSHRRAAQRAAPSLADRLQDALPGAVFNTLMWIAGLVGHAFRFAQKPLAVLMAVYLFSLGVVVLQSILTNSVARVFSPLCSVPGVGSLSMCAVPAFPGSSASSSSADGAGGSGSFVEFDGLMSVQSKFEQVLEKSAEGVSLPLEMKKSETAVRDLRSLLRFSDLPARDEIVGHFDGYIDVARKVVRHMQMFNTHVGTAVDAVLSINHWTLRFLDSAVLAEQEADGSDGSGAPYADGRSQNRLVRLVMMPLNLVTGTPPARRFSEEVLLEKYIEHTAYVSKRIADLIVEAQYILGLLTMAEDHLSLIYGVSAREERQATTQRDAVRWSLGTLLGANHKELAGLDDQISLLQRVDAQRSQAVAQVSALIIELESMQAGLDDLRERVAAPEMARVAGGAAGKIPLQVHIDTINKGVERLDSKREYIRAVESEQLQRAMDRARGREDQQRVPAIGGRR